MFGGAFVRVCVGGASQGQGQGQGQDARDEASNEDEDECALEDQDDGRTARVGRARRLERVAQVPRTSPLTY